MLYYLLFWTLLGFIIHFYIIFGTNLLTGGPAQNCCFFAFLGVRRKGISNGVQTEWNLWERDFLNEQDPGDLDPMSRKETGGHEVGGAPAYPRRALHPRGPPVAPPTYSFLLYIQEEGVRRWSNVGPMRVEGAPRRVGAPPTSWLPGSFLDVGSKSSGSHSFRKSRSWRSHSVWTPFDILFLRNSKIGKKTSILGWASD